MKVGDLARSAFLALPWSTQKAIRHRLGRRGLWEDGAPEPPPCPPGMQTGPPDFVGIGAAKAGTTWWFRLLLSHPDVYSHHPKEIKFFNNYFFEHVGTAVEDAELHAYHDWFPRPAGARTGEWTPYYMFWYRLPPLLRRVAPDAKLLVLLRDPVERFQSEISMQKNRSRLRNQGYPSFARGFYSQHLAHWEAQYEPERMLVLQFERCMREPEAQLAATYRFLGLDEGYRPSGLTERVNVTRVKWSMEPGLRRMLAGLYEADVAALASRYQALDLGLWPNFSHLDGS